MAPSLFKRVYEIEKNGKRQCSRIKRTLAGLRFSRQVCEGLKQREILESSPHKTAQNPPENGSQLSV